MVNSLETISRRLDKEMIQPLRQSFVMRTVIPVNTELSAGGIGMTKVEVLTLAEMGAAEMSYAIPARKEDTLDPTLSSINIPLISKDFRIPRRAYEAFKAKGIPIDSSLGISAAQVVQIKEEVALLTGWSAGGATQMNGIYSGAGQDYSTSKTFATYGNATDAVIGAKVLLADQNVFGPFNLILATAPAGELAASRSTNDSREIDVIREILGAGGRIIESPQMTDNTGLLCPTYSRMKPYADLIYPFPMQTIMGTDSVRGKLSDIFGTVIEAMAVRIKQSNAFCKLSAI